MQFERFTEIGRGYAPKVSITRSGLIGLNQGAVRRFRIEDYEYAVLYFNRADEQIGIGLTNDENEQGACKIRKRTSGADVSAKAFFDFYGIDYESTNRYDARWDDDEEKIIVDIK